MVSFGFGYRYRAFEFGVAFLIFWVRGLGFSVYSLRCRIEDSGYKVIGFRDRDLQSSVEPRLRGTCASKGLARGQLAELHFWKSIKVFPYHSNSQNSSVLVLNDTPCWVNKKIL